MRERDEKAISAVGRNITKYRNEKGWSVRKLATISLIEHSSISEYENGKKDIGISVITRLSKALEIHPGKLFDGFDE
ncbi:helix-turn-helix domain-containing protein [Pedobacter sp. WC2423]|uniref:helix-turn-helix domain-containing protein n=1 Tax=Pedobacter sp. WC2423 TaxID=3234142 RepID=UPI003467D436